MNKFSTILTLIAFMAAWTLTAQNPISVSIEKMNPEQKNFQPFEQVIFTYNIKGKLNTEKTLKWQPEQKLWKNQSVWKKSNKKISETGLIVKRWSKKGEAYTQKNATFEHTFTHKLTENYLDRFNPLYTRRSDGKLLEASYDRCRSNEVIKFVYDFDGRMTNYEKIKTGQYGEVTKYRGTFAYELKDNMASTLTLRGSLKDVEVNVFPNPSTGLFNVSIEEFSSNLNQEVLVRIENMEGAEIRQIKASAHQRTIPVNLANAPAGMYMVKTFVGDQQRTHKVIITK